MYLKFIVIFFVFSLTTCRCGLLNLFSDSDALHSENAKIKYREQRGVEENGIVPDITNSVSLLDIEKEKLNVQSKQEPNTEAHHGNPKAKRYPYRVSAANPMVGAARQTPKFLPLVKRDMTPEERCDICKNRPACRLLGSCAQCNEDCKNIAVFTDDILTPWSNQTVGMAHRMKSPEKNDIFSKTLYPMSTFRDGETKDIICRIVGITDTSDIETVTIWVTTYSNTPPRSLNDVTTDSSIMSRKIQYKNVGQSEATLTNPNKMEAALPSKNNGAPPGIQTRFNDYDDEGTNTFSRLTDNDANKIKSNPDVIEGPPPFVGSNPLTDSDNNNLQESGISGDTPGSFKKPIIVQPKEFESDESDEDDDGDLSSSSVVPLSPLKIKEEPTTIKSIIKPTLLSKLRQLAASRTNKLADILDRRQKIENNLPSTGGFIKNLITPRQDVIENPNKIVSSSIQNSLQNTKDNMEGVTANENETPPIRLPGESDDQIAKISEAIQEVKSMVKNIQDEASKASEKRVLGASHSTSEDLAQNSINVPNRPVLTNDQMPQVLPDHVADNLKKVNYFLINRAQDALDMIRPQEKKEEIVDVGGVKDEHSEITKNTISNLKKMPEFFLERFKDTMNGFDSKSVGSPVPNIETNTINEEPKQENIELSERFGDDNVQVEATGTSLNTASDEAVLGLAEQSKSDNETNLNTETSPNIDIPNTKKGKSKLERYLAELKEKRQNTYSPERYSKSPSKKFENMASLPVEEVHVESTAPSDNQNIIISQKDAENNYARNKLTGSNILGSANDLEQQRDILRQKLRKFINGVKSKTTSLDETTPSLPSNTYKEMTNAQLLPILSNQDQSSTIKPIVTQPQTLPALAQSPVKPNSKTTEELNDSTFPQNIPQNIFNENADQVVGESMSKNTPEENIYNFLPTVSTVSNNNVIPTETSNFQKYLNDLRAKQILKPALLKPKAPSVNSIQNRNQGLESENQPNDKKDLLKEKLKNFVNKLQKPAEETVVGQPDIMSVNQRISDEMSNLNNKVTNDMKNLFGSSPEIFKKDLLKEKLKDYVNSLGKPMGSRLMPEILRKSSDTQREELNSLKRKLENLIKPKEFSLNLVENPLVSKVQPNIEPLNINVPSPVDKNIDQIINRGKADIQNNIIVGDTQHSSADSQTDQINDETSFNRQLPDTQDINLQSTGSLNEKNIDTAEWSHNLGKIVQSSSKPADVFFLGSGIKLPLKVTQSSNGSMDLSVDLEKLCSCYNATCPKNHTAIEETVGEILEKEAELNEQLNSNTPDDVKIEPVLGSPQIVSEPAVDEVERPTLVQRLLNGMKGKAAQKGKSNIFKRSSDIRGLGPELTTIKNVLEKLKKENEKNMKNNISKDTPLKLPTLDVVAEELTNLGMKIKDSFTNSVQDLKNNVDELRVELKDKFIEANQDSSPLLRQNLPEIPAYNNDWLEDNLNEIKERAEDFNNNVLEKLEHANTLTNLLNVNGIQNDNGANLLGSGYVKSFQPDYSMINGLNKIAGPTENPLDIIKKSENVVKKIMRKSGLNRFQLLKTQAPSTTKDPLMLVNELQEKIKQSLPAIPELQNRMDEVNDEVVKITDAYQFGKANVLEKKLEQLDNEVQKYYKSNEKLLAGESKKLLGGHNNDIVDKEVRIINKIISWIRSLASGIKIQ